MWEASGALPVVLQSGWQSAEPGDGMELYVLHVLLLTVTIATAVLAQTEHATRMSRCYARCRSYSKRSSRTLCFRFFCRLAILGYYNRFGKRGAPPDASRTPGWFPREGGRGHSLLSGNPARAGEENEREIYLGPSPLRAASPFGQPIRFLGQSQRGNAWTVQRVQNPDQSADEGGLSLWQIERRPAAGGDLTGPGLHAGRDELVSAVRRLVDQLEGLSKDLVDILQRGQLQDPSPAEPFENGDNGDAFQLMNYDIPARGNEADKMASTGRSGSLVASGEDDATDAEAAGHTHYRLAAQAASPSALQLNNGLQLKNGLQLNNLPQRAKSRSHAEHFNAPRSLSPGSSPLTERTPEVPPFPAESPLLWRGKSRVNGRPTSDLEVETFPWLHGGRLPPTEGAWDTETALTADSGRYLLSDISVSDTDAEADPYNDRLGELGDLSAGRALDTASRSAATLLTATDLRPRRSFTLHSQPPNWYS